ncbi:tyrosine-protein phosphatase [Glutamicibacter uratoxydans]|uniref:tyrosine-protein phosphatase n=1 Tax=Glutamicibacter uratoxydans TaxID=43667 RepID=UPI003D6DF4FA
MTITTEHPLSAPANLRDLGGIAIAGGLLRQGLAIRTDDLSLVTGEVAEELVANGLTAIIDLRSIEEVQVTGRGPLGGQAVSYHHIPLMGKMSESLSGDSPTLTHESMGQMYLNLVERASSQLVTALNVIAYSPGTTAFHCTAGRDRTGVLAASLLLVLGASDADIVADYSLTGPNMPGVGQRTRSVLGPLMRKLGFDLDKLSAEGNLHKEGMEVSMQFLLEQLRTKYTDPLTPLRIAGLSEDTIAQLRRRAAEA